MSSAYNKLLIDLAPMPTGVHELSNTLVMSLIKILNKLGLRLSPWKTPIFLGKGVSEIFPVNFYSKFNTTIYRFKNTEKLSSNTNIYQF